MKARDKKETNLMLDQIKEWLVSRGELSNSDDILEKVTEIDSTIYRRWSREVISLFNWLRRFAEGYLNKNKKDISK